MESAASAGDTTIRQHVRDELESDPAIDAGAIGVTVERGIVTLMGTVPTYHEALAAQHATVRVTGVRAVANELTVKTETSRAPSDTDIATAIANVFARTATVPKGIAISVSHGHVTLTGAVPWQHQRMAAEETARGVTGVTGVADLIEIVQPSVASAAIVSAITRALVRNAEVEATRVRVTADDGTVTLMGIVQSWAERAAAERAAWRAAGVTQVMNEIAVEP